MNANILAAFFVIGISAALAQTMMLDSTSAYKDLAASQLKRKLAQTGSLEALVNSLPTTKASNNPPSELPPLVEIFAAAPLSTTSLPLKPLSAFLAPTPGPAPSSLLSAIEGIGRRLSATSLEDLVNSLPTTTAGNNPPSKVPVEIFAAAPAYSSGPPATDVSPPPAVELVTPTPAPAPSTQLPTIAIGGRRLSESVVDLINTLPATTASNNPPSKVPTVKIFASTDAPPATPPTATASPPPPSPPTASPPPPPTASPPPSPPPTASPPPPAETYTSMDTSPAPAPAPGQSQSASDLPTLTVSGRKMLQA